MNGGIKYLTYCIKIEKTIINFLSPTQKDYICKKWLPFETVLSALLQNVCFYKLNVFCLSKIAYACHMFFVFVSASAFL